MGDSLDTLGRVIKDARIRAGLSRKIIASRLSITPRHLMSIENGRQKPSYDLLYRLIRELSVPTEPIFYPELTYDSIELKQVATLLRMCDDKEISVINAALHSLLKSE